MCEFGLERASATASQTSTCCSMMLCFFSRQSQKYVEQCGPLIVLLVPLLTQEAKFRLCTDS